MRKAILSLVMSSLIIWPFCSAFAISTPYRYEGKPFDTETNLYDFQARKYNPGIGQFIQSDTYLEELLMKGAGGNDPELQRLLANPQLLNQRSFKSNNPINYVDPSGHQIESVLQLQQIAPVAISVGKVAFSSIAAIAAYKVFPKFSNLQLKRLMPPLKWGRPLFPLFYYQGVHQRSRRK